MVKKILLSAAFLLVAITFQNCGIEEAGKLSQTSQNSSISPSPVGSPATEVCQKNQKQIAFPGAEGFGRCAQGGRGGRAIEVTNLNDNGPGSLRECMQESGSRTCIFKVGGTINLTTCTDACTSSSSCPKTSRPCQWPTIQVNHSYLTIAGQTAPGDGIMIKGGLEIGGSLSVVSDVIIRHIRIRPGAALPNMSALFVRSNDSIVDHVSTSWVTDESISVLGTSGKPATNVTIQWSIMSEGIGGGHGLLVGGGSSNPATNVTVHHNYFAMNWVRNPLLMGEGGVDSVVDNVNNLAYYMNDGATSAPCRAPLHHNYVGNAFIAHSTTNNFKEAIRLLGPSFVDDRCNYSLYSPMSGVYVKGNIDRYRTSDSMPERTAVNQDNGGIPLSATRFNFVQVKETDAFQAYKDVLAGAGATKPKVDIVDKRVLDMARPVSFVPGNIGNGVLGKIINNESEVGGFPTYNNGVTAVDSDHDGIPDTRETSMGLNPNDAMDGAFDRNNDGYTNLEEYLNSI